MSLWTHVNGTTVAKSATKLIPWTVAQGNLVVVSVPCYRTGSVSSLSDSTGANTWTPCGSFTVTGNIKHYVFAAVIAAGGGGSSVTLQVNGSPAFEDILVDEFHCTGTIHFGNNTSANAAAGANNLSPSSGSVLGGGTNSLIYGSLGWNGSAGTVTQGTNFTPGNQVAYSTGQNMGGAVEWWLGHDNTSVAATFTTQNAVDWACVVSTFWTDGTPDSTNTPSPSTVYSNNPLSQTVTLTGNNTNWTAPIGTGTVFSVSGVSGVSIVSQTINSATSATLVLSTLGSGTGALSITNTSDASIGLMTVALAPVVAAPHVTKCGRLFMVGAVSTTPAANGASPLPAITSISGTPTVERNGVAVQLGPATWFNEALDSPFVAYLLQCGGVDRIAITNGGTGYTGTPTASASGGGGSGLVLGTPTTASGVTSYTVTNGGSGYSAGPLVAFSGGGGTGATAYAIVISGAIVGYYVAAGGTGYTSAPTVTVTGSGSNATAVAMVSGGAVTAVTAVTVGKSYHTAPAVTPSSPPNTSGPSGNVAAQAIAVVDSTGVVRAVLPMVSSLLGYGTGYTTATATIAAPTSGVTATVTATVSNYVASVPVTSPGSGYTSPPSITISGGSGTGATVMPIMTGVSNTDVITYSAPANWFATALGSPVGASNTAVTNWTGQLEGPTDGMTGFQAAATMPLGASVGEQPAVNFSSNFTAKNRRLQGKVWTAVGTGILSTGLNGFPISWTNPSATYVQQNCYGPNAGNSIDSMTMPNQAGQWTVQYDDPAVNTASASAVWLSAFFSNNVTVAPVSLSGDGLATAGTVTLAGNAVTAIAVASGGTGYQGAGVSITGGGGSGASAIATVSGGAVTGITVINGGSGYTSTPIITIYGTKVSGTAVTAVFDFEYVASPATWTIGVLQNVANAAGSWTITNPWVVAPIASTDLAATVDRSNPLAVDDSILAVLKAGGKTPAVLRFMDVTAGFGGIANYIDDWDLTLGPQVGDASWNGQVTCGVKFAAARFIQTNPAKGSIASGGDGTYNWTPSTKVYGNQPWAVGGMDAGSTITGNLTSGSAVVTNISSTAGIIAGAVITGVGIPTGTYVAMLGTLIQGNITSSSAVVTGIASTAGLAGGMSVWGAFVPNGTTILSVDSATQITLSANATATTTEVLQVGTGSLVTLSANATATATGETLTITNPPYASLSTSDNGKFVYSNIGGAQQWSVLELRSTLPHGFKTGQYIKFSGTTGVTLTGATVPALLPLNTFTTAWVTSPTTVCIALFCGGSEASSTNPQTVSGTAEQAIDWTGTLTIPYDADNVPYEYAAAMCNQVGCDLWLNIPHAATDGLVKAIAAKVIANVGPTTKVYLEFGNENWNRAFPSNFYHMSLSILMGYVTPGTSLFDGHLIAYGQSLPNGAYGSIALTTSHAFDTFAAAWVAAGQSSSRIKRVYGTQAVSPTVTQSLMTSLQASGITAVDHIAIAPYMTLPTDCQVTTALSPSGPLIATAGSWPVDAMNDLFRYWMTYSQTVWGWWSGHAQYAQGLGQPLVSSNLSATGGGATGGSLAAGAYYATYTFVDTVGKETTIGFSRSGPVTIASGNIPSITMPSWPTWAASMRIYLTLANGAAGTEVLYLTIPRTSFGYGNTYPIGSLIPLSAVNTGSVAAPLTNLAAARAPSPPRTVCYEGSLQVCPSVATPLQDALSMDRHLHPSSASAHTGFWEMCQQGNPTFANSGAALMMYYQLINPPSYPDMWTLIGGSQQLPGAGSVTAASATIQGGPNPDGHSHFQAVSPAALAFQEWFQEVPAPTPSVVTSNSRRWFSGLRRIGRLRR